MRRFILSVSVAVWCVPGLVLAIPPREGSKQQRPGQHQQRPASNPGSPSLSPPRGPGGGGPGGGKAGGGRPGGAGINRGGPGSNPAAINIGQGGGRPGGPGFDGGNRPRPGTRPSGPSIVSGGGDRNPSAGNLVNLPGGQRPGTRPAQRPDVTFHRPDGSGNRPDFSGNRPDIGGNRPDIGVNRPDIAGNRPSLNRPNVDGNRPVINRPDITVNRPVINKPDVTVNRPVVVNRPITNIDNTVVNRNTVVNQNISNRQFNNNYGGYGTYARSVPNYYSRLHYQWQPTTSWGNYQPMYSNYYANSTGYSGNWMGSGVARYSYANPFYSAASAATVTNQVYDYSQPIRVPQADYQETNDDLVRSEQAIRRFDDARELFRRGEYGRANDAADEAVKILPSDPTLHQLRGLILFARGRYPDAAAAVYSVLGVSPGWDWETVSKLYDDPNRYEEQLGELQNYATAHPEATDAQFLLAYHATILGDAPVAEAELELVRAAKPNDQLVNNLLAALQQGTPQQ